MHQKIEDYALIGNCETAGLVSREGSIDWLCLPHFDSGACFAKLLGTNDHGFWKISPIERFESRRSYHNDSMVLETVFVTATGEARLIDAMSMDSDSPQLVRQIRGLKGYIDFKFEWVVRFDYGSVIPWMRRIDAKRKMAIGGPDGLLLSTTFPVHGEGLRTVGNFRVLAKENQECVLNWFPSHQAPKLRDIDVTTSITETDRWWKDWIEQCTYKGEFKDDVRRSLLTLKSLTFAPTGGIVAAPTTSLPELIGGSRNWDYRFSWLRDSTFTLYSFLTTGFSHEAEEWRQWLVRTVAGTPEQLNIMYGIRGERRLTEVELDWLPGYKNSRPVRIGNAAYKQRQLDIFGEVMDSLQLARRSGLANLESAWNIQKEIINFVIKNWDEPDEGIWEIRGPRQHFVHSKVMAWVALDRGLQAVEKFGLDGNAPLWREVREQIKNDILNRGFNTNLGSFTQCYRGKEVDASLLMLPLVGFVSADDPRMVGTVAKIEKDLMEDGLLLRYRTDRVHDGLKKGEGKFLACSFWLADYYVLANQRSKAYKLFSHLRSLMNDVGLLAEEYDTENNHLVGNFPQALSHIALVNTAVNLSQSEGSAQHRSHPAKPDEDFAKHLQFHS